MSPTYGGNTMGKPTTEVIDDDFRPPNEHRGLKKPRQINKKMVLYLIAMVALPAIVYLTAEDKKPRKVVPKEETKREKAPDDWINILDEMKVKMEKGQSLSPNDPGKEPTETTSNQMEEEIADPRILRYGTGTGVIEIKGYLAGSQQSQSFGSGGPGYQGGFARGYNSSPYGLGQAYGGPGGPSQAYGGPGGSSYSPSSYGATAPEPRMDNFNGFGDTKSQSDGRLGIDKENISDITDTLYPKVLKSNVDRLLEGTSIPAVLVTPINTMIKGGLVKARITEAVQAFPGGKDLLKPYDLALGKVAEGATHQLGLNRIPVKWHRIIRYLENGDIVDVPINSGSADALGGPGIPANRNVHFWEKSGFALMFSLVDATVSNVNAMGTDEDDEVAQEWRGDFANAFGSTAKRALQALDITRTDLSVPRARPITIQTAVDLYFGPEQIIGRDAR